MIGHAFDASIPPSKPYPGTNAVQGYIGGITPHVWENTEEKPEWLNATSHGELRCGPIWVIDFKASILAQVNTAVTNMRKLGWRPHIHRERALFIDGESSTDASYIRQMGLEIHALGFWPVDYRSADVLDSNPSGLDEWVARWDQSAGPFTQRQIEFQYDPNVEFDGTTIDLSAFDEECWRRFGRGPRKVLPA